MVSGRSRRRRRSEPHRIRRPEVQSQRVDADADLRNGKVDHRMSVVVSRFLGFVTSCGVPSSSRSDTLRAAPSASRLPSAPVHVAAGHGPPQEQRFAERCEQLAPEVDLRAAIGSRASRRRGRCLLPWLLPSRRPYPSPSRRRRRRGKSRSRHRYRNGPVPGSGRPG